MLKFLLNIGKFIALVRAVEKLIKDIKDGKGATGGVDLILSVSQDLFLAGAIDIPGVDENQIATTLQEVRNQLV